MRIEPIEIVGCLVCGIITFYAPAMYAIGILALLVLIDTIYGVRTSTNFEYIKFVDFLIKGIYYSCIISIAVLVFKSFHIMYVVWIICAVPIWQEIKSINRHQKKLGKSGIISDLTKVFEFWKTFRDETKKE